MVASREIASLPIGIVTATWPQVYDATVSSFSEEAAQHRRRLLWNAVSVCRHIVEMFCTATVLIDGSFVTIKEFPNDIDVWIFASQIEQDPTSDIFSGAWLHSFRDSSKRDLGVDVFVFPTIDGKIVEKFGEIDYEASSVDWFISQLGEWFQSGRDDEPPKGAFLLEI